MLPLIEKHAKIAFRHLNPDAREEAVQETVCNACLAYRRLAELGKADLAYPTPLATFGVRQTMAGRKVGSKLNCRDVAGEYCQRITGLVVERLDRYDPDEAGWAEVLVEDRRAGPAETAIVRIDFSTWLHLLPRRLRRIATFLASGETTNAAARKFSLSQSRISQFRRELYQFWHRFQGDEAAMAVV
jgi:hypothetical protein